LKGTGDDLSDSAQIILVTIGNTGIGHFMHRLVYTTTKCWVLISMSCGWSPRLGALLGVHALSMHGERDSFPDSEALIPVCATSWHLYARFDRTLHGLRAQAPRFDKVVFYSMHLADS
jgi:hypothetical protein